MNDPKKIDEINKKIQDIGRQIETRKSNKVRIERDLGYQIKNEEREIERLDKQIDELKRQIK